MAFKPTCWFRYADDRFMIWLHGPEELQNFLNHIRNTPLNTQFTMKNKTKGQLPFLDFFDMAPWETPCTGNTPTPTCIVMLSHTTTQTISILSCPPWYTEREAICKQESLAEELEFLRSAFEQNGCSGRQIHQVLDPPPREDTLTKEPTLMAFLPFVGLTFNLISVVQTGRNTQTVVHPPRNVASFLWTSTASRANKVYIRQTGFSSETRSKSTNGTAGCIIRTNQP